MKTTIITIIIAAISILISTFSFNNLSEKEGSVYPNVKTPQLVNLKVESNLMTNQFTISENDLVKRVTIYNLIGKEVKSFDVENGSNYNLNGLPTGMYLVSFSDGDETVFKTVRLEKRRLMRA